MKRRIIRILAAVGLALSPYLMIVTPAFAIGNPTSLLFGAGTSTNMYQIFQNVNVSGDMLIAAETYVHYLVTPTDYKSNESYSFELLDTNGTTVLFSTPVLSGTASSPNTAYEDFVNSIYLTPTQAATLTWQSAYYLRLTINPSIAAPVEGTNQTTKQLVASDYITDSPAGTSKTLLGTFVIHVMQDLQTHDTPTNAYLANVQGVLLITTTGAQIATTGIPGLNNWLPSIFQTTVAPNTNTPSDSGTNTYANTLTVTNSLGANTNRAIVNLATWFGITQTMAGGLVMVMITLIVSGYAYIKTQSLVLPDVLAILMPLLGVYLGLIPMAIAFIFIVALVILSVYYFLTRGIL